MEKVKLPKGQKYTGRSAKRDNAVDRNILTRRAKISQRECLNSNLLGKDAHTQFRKRIGIEGTKIHHHTRTITDLEIIEKESKKLVEGAEVELAHNKIDFADPGIEKEKQQIIEIIDPPNMPEDGKAGDVDLDEKLREERIQKQMEQAEELVAKFKSSNQDDDFASDENALNDCFYDQDDEGNEEEAETEIEVIIGELRNDVAILTSKDCYLMTFPTDMLPPDIKKGEVFSILVKRNTHSEVLRENAIWTTESQLFALLNSNKAN